MAERVLSRADEITTDDFVSIPGLSNDIRLAIHSVTHEPDGSWTVEVTGATINLPFDHTEMWIIKP